MAHNILLTGASGYLGGSLLAAWQSANLTSYSTLYALVRTDAQADAVKTFGAVPIRFDAYNSAEVQSTILEHRITVVLGLIDAWHSQSQANFITALAAVRDSSGIQTHFVHTTGAKQFSEWAGHPIDSPLLDTNANLYSLQKESKAQHPLMQEAVDTNCTVVELGLKHDVRTYIFAPCLVYGKGKGFGNPISIQSVDIIRAALAAGKVYKTADGRPSWPAVHLDDNTALYIALVRAILDGQNPDSGRNGYYLASSGHVVWDDIYEKFAKILKWRDIIKDDSVVIADDAALEKMARGLGCPKDFVAIRLAGRCAFTAEHGYSLGWKPRYPADHILEAAEEEVDRILENYKELTDGMYR